MNKWKEVVEALGLEPEEEFILETSYENLVCKFSKTFGLKNLERLKRMAVVMVLG